MKKLFILMLILSCSIFTKGQDSRWKLLRTSDTTKEKIYIDTTRNQKLQYFEGHRDVVVIWLKMVSIKQGGNLQEVDEKVVVDVANNQLELKSVLKRNNGKENEQQQFLGDWKDIYPETLEEYVLFYCKKYLQSISN